jgi:hypothetical protein
MLIAKGKKLCQNSCEKTYQRKSDRKIDFLFLLLCAKAFGLQFFPLFSTDSISASSFAFYETHIEFANFNAKRGGKV